MSEHFTIRILEEDSNRRGDLFGSLMTDLFVAQGYEPPRVNIHKSGREVDIQTKHRLETRKAIGECKATKDPIGGDDLNKFVGTLDAEDDTTTPITGYFISLSGFKETAIEQEMARKRTKIILLSGPQVVSELVKGRRLIPFSKATDLAGRLHSHLPEVELDSEADLLVHARGWIWAIYYTQGKTRTHFALIHADGTPLARSLAEEVIDSDRRPAGGLSTLVCLNPKPLPRPDSDAQIQEALSAYREYLEHECGFIYLDGLPADSEVGSRRMRLESLFVPLHLDITSKDEKGDKSITRRPVGEVLLEHPRLALLAPPGGGKSTLIKRLAVAAIDLKRRDEIDDAIPWHDWLPLFFRCRELRDLARASFSELLDAICHREPVRQYAKTFRALIDRALLENRIILLIDGLDEISDQGDRAAFVCTLRTTLQAYPGISVVITSREAGFRHVASHLAPVCTQAGISPLNAQDIGRLSVNWHREVVGDTATVREDAKRLAKTIVKNDRIRSLAVNPLLLTTLLLVKRWVGSLPTRRTALYDKAIDVLLMTWNVEGHDPIPTEEALPQLCYVASAMMQDGLQKISRPRLVELLATARHDLPTELGYVTGTVEAFIRRVEERSSLLVMTGHEVENGLLVEWYEFRHLTFQEFLTAKGMVEGWHPRQNETTTLVDVLQPYLTQNEWRQVIPMAAVLGRKQAEGLLRRLMTIVESSLFELAKSEVHATPVYNLAACLADEAVARPETIQNAIKVLIRSYTVNRFVGCVEIAGSKYGNEMMREIKAQMVIWNESESVWIVVLFAQINEERQRGRAHENHWKKIMNECVELVNQGESVSRCEGAVGLVYLLRNMRALGCASERRGISEELDRSVCGLLFSENQFEQSAALWALTRLSSKRIWSPPANPDVLGRLANLGLCSPSQSVRRLACAVFLSQDLHSRDENRCATLDRILIAQLLVEFSDEVERRSDDIDRAWVGLLCLWYVRALTDQQLLEQIKRLNLSTSWWSYRIVGMSIYPFTIHPLTMKLTKALENSETLLD
jgi:hypothetical protein